MKKTASIKSFIQFRNKIGNNLAVLKHVMLASTNEASNKLSAYLEIARIHHQIKSLINNNYIIRQIRGMKDFTKLRELMFPTDL